MDAPRTNWWDDDPEIAHKSLFALCNNLEQEQQGRLAEWLHFTRLYSNKSNNLERNQFLPPGAGGFDMVRLNVVASITDTMVAKLTQDNPALMFLTSNAYETQQQMAEQLGTWSDGVIYENKFYRTAPKILRDAIIYGTGLNVVSRTRQNKIKFTRGFCANFIVDDTTAEEDDPQELYAKKLCARASLLNEFRDDKAAIESINSSNPAKNEYNASSWVPDRLLVRESWHLPWFDDDGEPHDGKHILAVEGGTLLSEEWKKPYFPVVRMHFKEPILGWWGGSLPGDIDGIQLQINKLLKFINMSQHLGSNLRVLVDTAADIVGAHLDNQIGTIVKYSSLKGGRPPEWTTPQAWHPQVYE